MEEKAKKKNNRSLIFFYVGLALLIIAVILVILFGLRGETVTFGNNPDPETSSSLSCGSIGFDYPFFSFSEAKKRTIETRAIFNGGDLDTITLTYTLDYDDPETIEKSEASNHATMNILYAKDDLPPDAFDTKYSQLSDSLKFSMSADSSTISKGKAKKYFLLEDIGDAPYRLETLKKAYQQKGLKCEQK